MNEAERLIRAGMKRPSQQKHQLQQRLQGGVTELLQQEELKARG